MSGHAVLEPSASRAVMEGQRACSSAVVVAAVAAADSASKTPCQGPFSPTNAACWRVYSWLGRSGGAGGERVVVVAVVCSFLWWL